MPSAGRSCGGGGAPAVVLLLASLLIAAGCAAPGDPLRELQRAASAERPEPPQRPSPPPPGVDPAILNPPDRSPESSRSFEEAIAELRTGLPETETLPPRRPIPGEPWQLADEALRAYLRGRLAIERGNLPLAVGELERAHVLDPDEASILRQLGRAYAASGNPARAIDAFRRLRAIEPLDAEALFSIGIAAAEMRDHRLAAAALLRLREVVASDASVDATPATVAAAEHALCEALASLGFDRAFIEFLPVCLAHPVEAMLDSGLEGERAAELLRRRERLLRAAGDACLRRGDPDGAAAWYLEALSRPLSDPRPLLARLVHARLAAGRSVGAAAELAAVLAEPPFGEGETEVELARHLRRSGVDPALLAAAAEAMLRDRPEESRLLRVLAAIEGPSGSSRLRQRAIAELDDRCVADLLADARREGLAAAAAETVSLVAAEPQLLEPAVRSLASGGGSWAEIRDALDALPLSAARDAVRAQLRVLLRDPAAAWSLLGEDPEGSADPTLLRARIAAAAALRDGALLARLEPLLPQGQAPLRDAFIEALLDSGASERAWRLVAERSDEELAELPPRRRSLALLQLSRAAAAESAEAEPGRSGLLRRLALEAAEAAAESDPRSEAVAAWRLRLLDPRAGLLPDAAAHARLAAETVAMLGDRPLAERIRIEQELGQGRGEEAVARAEALLRIHPTDPEALPALAAAEIRLGRQRSLFDRLSRRLETHAADPQSWDLWTAAAARGGSAAVAEARLAALAQESPDHPFADSLRAALWRSLGRGVEAEELSLKLLGARPRTPGVAIERAAILLQRASRSGGAGARERAVREAALAEAIAELSGVVGEAPRLSASERVRAFSLLLAVDAAVDGRNAALLSLARAAIAADPEASLSVHGAGLLGAAGVGLPAEPFEALVLGAIASPQGRQRDDAAAARWLGIADRLLAGGFPEQAAQLLSTVLLEVPWPAGESRRILNAAAVALEARRGGLADATAARLAALASRGALPPQGRLLRDAAASGPSEEESSILLEASNIYGLVGDSEGSLRLLELRLEESPDDAMALNNLGYGRVEKGLVDARSESLLERAFALLPENPQIVDSLGWLRYRQGRLADGPWGEGAVTLLRRAVELGGAEPNLESLDHLADALWRKGATEEAIRLWQRVVEAGMRRFDREITLRGIEGFLRAEFGMLVVDPARFYAENLVAALERARAKLRQVADRQPPAVAPLAEPSGEAGREIGSG